MALDGDLAVDLVVLLARDAQVDRGPIEAVVEIGLVEDLGERAQLGVLDEAIALVANEGDLLGDVGEAIGRADRRQVAERP
jgi:hypothetical protein